MNTLHIQSPVGAFVTDDYRTSLVFRKYGIDYCCSGKTPLAEACAVKSLSPELVLEELSAVRTDTAPSGIDFKSWPADLVIDYIEKKHHRYVESRIPVMSENLHTLVMKHGARYPELEAIRDLFVQGAQALTMHMKKEELILFPAIRKMLRPSGQSDSPAAVPVEDALAAMEHEHDTEGARFRKISDLTGAYTPPAAACTTHRVTWKMLAEFEEDLHAHIHLENNILFDTARRLLTRPNQPA
jgi:regulator of cell morphogenesis and NO signaling